MAQLEGSYLAGATRDDRADAAALFRVDVVCQRARGTCR